MEKVVGKKKALDKIREKKIEVHRSEDTKKRKELMVEFVSVILF